MVSDFLSFYYDNLDIRFEGVIVFSKCVDNYKSDKVNNSIIFDLVCTPRQLYKSIAKLIQLSTNKKMAS